MSLQPANILRMYRSSYEVHRLPGLVGGTGDGVAALADAKREPTGVKSRHKTTLSN